MPKKNKQMITEKKIQIYSLFNLNWAKFNITCNSIDFTKSIFTLELIGFLVLCKIILTHPLYLNVWF